MPDSPLPPEEHQPLEAIVVVNVTPRKPPIRTAPLPGAQVTRDASATAPSIASYPPSAWSFQSPGAAQYVVPRTFGMSAIFGIITALAVLFGGFQLYSAHPLLYLFFGVQAVVICLAQMLYGKTPRAASALTGALLLPIFLIGWIGFWARGRIDGALCMLLISVPLGAFFGYLTGTMAAGVFLVMDAAERLLSGPNSSQNA